MPIDNVLFHGANPGISNLNNFNDTTLLRVDLRPTDVGKFVVFGRVVVNNWDGDPQWATARLTTLDGKTELDRVDVRIGDISNNPSQSISLQAVLELGPGRRTDPIVDIRAATYKGIAQQVSLFVIQMDDLRAAGF